MKAKVNFTDRVLEDSYKNPIRTIRFASLYDMFWYDIKANNHGGLGIYEDNDSLEKYMNERWIITSKKQTLLDRAQRNLQCDNSFQALMHKQKTMKRKFEKNKYSGNFSPIAYARDDEKMFIKQVPGKKRASLNIAVQPGTFMGEDYNDAFFEILKLLLSLQQLNINCNLDFFDSDTQAINGEWSLVLVNVFNTFQKFDVKSILCCSHREFFCYSLFNGYSASGQQNRIGTFLEGNTVEQALSPYYDIIVGNQLAYGEMMSTVTEIIHAK